MICKSAGLICVTQSRALSPRLLVAHFLKVEECSLPLWFQLLAWACAQGHGLWLIYVVISTSRAATTAFAAAAAAATAPAD